MRILICPVISLLFLVACSPQRTSVAARVAPLKMSFDVQPVAAPLHDSTTDRYEVILQKQALQKSREFLFQAEIIYQNQKPKFLNLKSRVVTFKRRGDFVYMSDSVVGNTFSYDLPQNFVLAQFPILKETAESLVIDFNAGMKALFVARDMHARDLDGSAYKSNLFSVPTEFSFIESAQLDAARQMMVIRQIAQLKLPDKKGDNIQNPTVEMKYYISPYAPDPTFRGRWSPGLGLTGFFELSPELRLNGQTSLRATKWNETKPIVYAISSNTPAEYRETVREGALYWNKAFGQEVVKVVEAPAGHTAPDAEYNIIQWVSSDYSGNAYADMQMDPRTGEILHAQVMLNSVFPINAKDQLRASFKRLATGEGEDPAPPVPPISLNGFAEETICDWDVAAAVGQMSPQIIKYLDANPGEDALAAMAKDLLRVVVAHEVGHTLGLRHNFAGTLVANFPLDQRDEKVGYYLRHQRVPPDAFVSSTVMEYMRFEDSLAVGNRVKYDEKPLEYDTKAIQVLYKGKSFRQDEIPPYCPDSQNGVYLDCLANDTGNSPVSYVKWSVEDGLHRLPSTILETFVRTKQPSNGGGPGSVEGVSFNVDGIARDVLMPRYVFRKAFTTAAKLVRIRRAMPFIGSLNEDDVRENEASYLLNEVNRLGGLKAVLFLPGSDFARKATARFNELLDSIYTEGLAPNGHTYQFTDAEKAKMKAVAKKLFTKLPLAFAREDLKILGGRTPEDSLSSETPVGQGQKINKFEIGQKFADLLLERAQRYIFDVSPQKTALTAVDGKTALPVYAYPSDVRLAAAALFRPGSGEALDWGYFERLELKKKMETLVFVATGKSPKDLRPEELNRSLANWIMVNSRIYSILAEEERKGP